MNPTRIAATFALAAVLSGSPADAQLPFATGREVALSRPQWKLFVPDGYEHRPGGAVDLLVHFHGDPQTVWNNAAHAELNAVIVTVNYNGLSSAYRAPFSDDSLFQTVLDDTRLTLITQAGFDRSFVWDRLAVSSFSAGYGAVREILSVAPYFSAIDSVLAADSLYATTAADGTPLDSQMVNYKGLASLASVGNKRFVFTHSQVETFTYESTAETGDELLAHLGLTAEPTNETGLGPLRFYRKAERGGFQLWGAEGAAGDDHLNHLRYMGEWLDDLGLDQRGLAGDLNGDGVVDAADYTAWRDADGEGLSVDDYNAWRANLGATGLSAAAAIPEPSAAIGATASIALGLAWRRGPRADQAPPRARESE